MALESGTYIDSLNSSNPAATDGIGQADDHLRLIKGTIKNTFPNIDGAVTATVAQLNNTANIPSALTDLGISDGTNGQILTTDGSGNFTFATAAAGLSLTDLSVGTEQIASGNGAISYNNSTGVFSYTPPTAAGIGALTAHPNISAASSENNSGNTFIQDITLDSNGHVTAIASAVAAAGSLSVSASDFTGTEGYIKFSNNFMIQWGQKTPTSGTTSVSFSPAFSTIVVWASAQLINNSQNYQSTAINPNYSTTGMTVYNDTEEFWWIAMGI